jgi:hypothetical protein
MDTVEDEDKLVCMKCLLENPASNAFCAGCNAPIGMISTIDPIQRNTVVGWVFRSAASGPPKLILLLGMWLLFAPVAVGATVISITGLQYGVLAALIPALVALYAVVVLSRTTHNYILKRAQVSG